MIDFWSWGSIRRGLESGTSVRCSEPNNYSFMNWMHWLILQLGFLLRFGFLEDGGRSGSCIYILQDVPARRGSNNYILLFLYFSEAERSQCVADWHYLGWHSWGINWKARDVELRCQILASSRSRFFFKKKTKLIRQCCSDTTTTREINDYSVDSVIVSFIVSSYFRCFVGLVGGSQTINNSI